MERTKEVSIKGCFTKYVETALIRARKDYLKKEQKRQMMEEITEPDLWNLERSEGFEYDSYYMQSEQYISWEPENIRAYLENQVSDKMRESLSALTDDELVIVFAKVFWNLTFIEIGIIMSKDWHKVASSYSYARYKIKKGWKKNGI